MKLSELRACDNCGGEIGRSFSVVRISRALVTANARAVLGTMAITGSRGIAEAMAPRANEAVCVLGDDEPKLMTELLICHTCLGADICLGILEEQQNEVVTDEQHSD